MITFTCLVDNLRNVSVMVPKTCHLVNNWSKEMHCTKMARYTVCVYQDWV